MFQFPLHRDPRCNQGDQVEAEDINRFSSLYIGILAATKQTSTFMRFTLVSVPFTSGSSLQRFFQQFLRGDFVPSFSSLYIGILAATESHKDGTYRDGTYVSVPFTSGSSLQLLVLAREHRKVEIVSVPFTSGSSLQLVNCHTASVHKILCFSSLYIGILAATTPLPGSNCASSCFSSLYIGILAAT